MSIDVFVVDAATVDLDGALAMLPAVDRERAGRIGAEHRRREFVTGRWLAAHALARCLGGRWGLRAAPNRRPVAVAEDGREHGAVNISHSHGLVACAVSTDATLALGCDLEARRRRSAASWRRIADAGLAHPMFTAAERRWLVSVQEEARDDHLIALWTVKEALGKATGHGIYRGALDTREAQLPALVLAMAGNEWGFRDVPLDAGWHAYLSPLPSHWLSVVVPMACAVRWVDTDAANLGREGG